MDLKGGGSIKRLLIISFVIVLDTLIAFECFAYAELITENEIFVTLYETKKVPYLMPEDDVKILWNVEDTNIASISSKGNIKGLSVGKTTITATAGEMSDSCTVYIKEPPPSLEINYKNNLIFGFEPLCEYLINGETCLSDSNGNILIQNDWLQKTIQISKKNIIEKCCSDSIELFIEHTHNLSFFATLMPTCILSGYSIYKCICGETFNDDFVPATGHKLSGFLYDGERHYQKCLNEGCDYIEKSVHDFDNGCDGICNTCGFERLIEHQFDNPCDTYCNVCNYERKVSHKFENSCSDTCIICGLKRAVSHTFDNSCDTECNLCGFTRIAEHKFDNECDKICNVCGYRRITEHKYESPCDKVCDICGEIREVRHNISKSYSKDDTSHFLECNICGKVFEREDHIFDNSCDTTCNICKFKRTVIHSLSDIYSHNKRSHYLVCNVCQKSFNKEPHIYSDAYDTTCNICGFVRGIKAKSTPKSNSNKTKRNNEKQSETANSNKNWIELTGINRNNKSKYALAFSATGITIVSMLLLIIFKKHKNPRD